MAVILFKWLRDFGAEGDVQSDVGNCVVAVIPVSYTLIADDVGTDIRVHRLQSNVRVASVFVKVGGYFLADGVVEFLCCENFNARVPLQVIGEFVAKRVIASYSCQTQILGVVGGDLSAEGGVGVESCKVSEALIPNSRRGRKLAN